MPKKNKRIPYIIAAIVLFLAEVFIGIFFKTGFIRAFFGDVLVTALLCSIIRAFSPERPKLLALWVFIFSCFVEILQYFKLADLLHVRGTIIGVIIGTSYDFRDIICYFCGCAAFFITEYAIHKFTKTNQ